MIATTGTTSKIMHPPEDVSLEELRARKPKYQIYIKKATQNPITSSVNTSIGTSVNATTTFTTTSYTRTPHSAAQTVVSSAQEV